MFLRGGGGGGLQRTGNIAGRSRGHYRYMRPPLQETSKFL